MNDYTYLFRKFQDQIVEPDNANDAVVKEIRSVAKEIGLTVQFNKMSPDMGGACVMPPDNEVTIHLTTNEDDGKWRVRFFHFS